MGGRDDVEIFYPIGAHNLILVMAWRDLIGFYNAEVVDGDHRQRRGP